MANSSTETKRELRAQLYADENMFMDYISAASTAAVMGDRDLHFQHLRAALEVAARRNETKRKLDELLGEFMRWPGAPCTRPRVVTSPGWDF